MKNMTEDQIQEMERERAKLKMLVGEGTDDEENMEFKGDKSDPRFITKNKEFALDPTHKHFNKNTHKQSLGKKKKNKNKH